MTGSAVYWISDTSDESRLQIYQITTTELRHSYWNMTHDWSRDSCVSGFVGFRCKRSVVKLIRCHAWTPGYHTPSCSTDPFNLFLSSSMPWTCLTVSGSSFPFLATPLRKRFKVNSVQLVVKSCTVSLCGSTMLCFLICASPLLPLPWMHTQKTCTHEERGERMMVFAIH